MNTRVTIGIPAYKNAATLARCVESILNQTYQDWRLIISDDGSPDETFALAQEYAARDARITAIRQEKNLYFLNFKYLLDAAQTPYFVWLAGDDYWAPEYLAECLAVLEKRPDCCGCVSQCLFFDVDGNEFLAKGTAARLDDPLTNAALYLQDPVDNTRMYGVFRTEALRESFPPKIMHAYDWALSAGTFRHGKHFEIQKPLLFREKSALENYVNAVRRDEKNRLLRLFPVLRMSLYCLKSGNTPFKGKIIKALIAINYKKHKQYMAFKHKKAYSRLAFLYDFFDKNILWRLVQKGG
ncbi:MAG: glycosyltransferase family 2 protein [Magnetospiraceae bacterium]